MRKNIWILNHYAINQFYNRGGRHYWFAENLIKHGYKPTVFSANIRHNTRDMIHVHSGKYVSKTVDQIPFVFVKTNRYDGNGLGRVQNMIQFYRNLIPAAKEYAVQNGKPDVILASSVHPLTLVAGLKIAKKFGVPCICEVRDLWPESLVAYGALKRKGLLTKILYSGEKWIYKRANAIVMTWQGGKQYIFDQNWENEIDVAKVFHISNGVVLQTFDENSAKYVADDVELHDSNFKNIIYTGSIRKVNNLGLLLDSAMELKRRGIDDVRFLIYGDGNERKMLENRLKEEQIDNVIFMGHVEKKYIPAILKRSYINILHNSSTSLDQYGQSQNKFFEYLAAGKCIVQTYTTGFSICEEFNCGISAEKQTAEHIADAIVQASNEEENRRMGQNARKAAHAFDFTHLTEKLIEIVEDV